MEKGFCSLLFSLTQNLVSDEHYRFRVLPDSNLGQIDSQGQLMTYTIGYGEGDFPAILKKQAPPPPPSEKFREQLAQLRDMGFLDQQVSALQSHPTPLQHRLRIKLSHCSQIRQLRRGCEDVRNSV